MIPTDQHVANLMKAAHNSYKQEPEFWPRRAKQAKYLGARSLMPGANLGAGLVTGYLTNKISNRLLQGKQEKNMNMHESHSTPTDISEVWATAARMALTTGAKFAGSKVTGAIKKDPMKAVKVINTAIKVGDYLMKNRNGVNEEIDKKAAAKELAQAMGTKARGAIKRSGVFNAKKLSIRRVNAMGRLARMKMGHLQRHSPVTGAVLGTAGKIAAGIGTGVAIGVGQNMIMHKLQKRQEKKAAQQHAQRLQQERGYQQHYEPPRYQHEDVTSYPNRVLETFSPKEMGAAMAAYKKQTGSHSLANAHVANNRFSPKDMGKAQKAYKLSTKTKTGTKVSEQVLSQVDTLFELGPGAVMTLPTAVKIGFAPHRALANAGKMMAQKYRNTLNPVTVGSKIRNYGKSFRT